MISTRDAAAHAAELHRHAIIIDGHCDILMPIVDGKIRLRFLEYFYKLGLCMAGLTHNLENPINPANPVHIFFCRAQVS